MGALKYLDGLTELAYWHRGRCLSYGDGVTYWALAEMARERFRIAEGEDADSAREKLSTALADFVPDDEERQWIAPRLAHLLGSRRNDRRARRKICSARGGSSSNGYRSARPSCSCSRTCNGRTRRCSSSSSTCSSGRGTTRSTSSRSRARRPRPPPRLADIAQHDDARARTPTDEAIAQLLEGLVPGLPDHARERILARAEGVPLYAVETVRMLLDKGLLRREGDVYVPAGELGELAIPETLHALAAARLDGLGPDERRALQDAAVLGKTFTKASLAKVSGRGEAELEPLLAFLVRREILGLQNDPRSPELGQYGFLQDLLRQVAYETLARPERKARHLAAAAYLESVRRRDGRGRRVASALGVRRRPGGGRCVKRSASAPGSRSCTRASGRPRSPPPPMRCATSSRHSSSRRPPSCTSVPDAPRCTQLAARIPPRAPISERAIEIREGEGEARGAARARARPSPEASGVLDHRAPEAIDLLQQAVDVLTQGEHDADLAPAPSQSFRVT